LPGLLTILGLLTAGKAPLFHLESPEPLPIQGRLLSIEAEGQVTIQTTEGTSKTSKLFRLRQLGVPRPCRPRVPMLLLSNGDLIPGEITGGNQQILRVKPQLSTNTPETSWTIPLSLTTAFWLVPPPADLPLDPAEYPWRENQRRHDTVLLRNGDVVVGTVEAINDGPSLRILPQSESAPRHLEFAQIAAVAFDPSLSRTPRPRYPVTRLITVEGMRLCLKSVTADASEIRGETCFGAIVRRPLHTVAALELESPEVVRLGEIKPQSEATEGYLSVRWPRTVNRSVKGRPLCLPAETGIDCFDYGFGTHPRCRLTYRLEKKYRRFLASVGLDPVTGRGGTAIIRILLDGQEQSLPGLNPLTAQNSPVAIDINLSGVRELTLLVDFGPTGDVQADVNWGDPRLIR